MTDTVHPPNPSTVLRQFRRARDLTMDDMAAALDCSKQTISKYEAGGPIPFERIREWMTNPAYEFWVKEMAYQLWVSDLYTEIGQLNQRVDELAALAPVAAPTA